MDLLEIRIKGSTEGKALTMIPASDELIEQISNMK